MYYLLYTKSRINKPLIFASDIEIKQYSIVKCKVLNKTDYAIVIKEVDDEFIHLDGLKIEKIKHILEVSDYQFNSKTVEFLEYLMKYNIQKLYDVVDSFLSQYQSILNSKVAPKEQKVAELNSKIALSPEQSDISHEISTKIKNFGVHFIHGVTGSGKTMVYLDIVAKYLQNTAQGQVLVCLPEISLTPQTQEFFENFLGIKPVIWHSKITSAKKRDIIHGITKGIIRLIIGTRSSILLDFADLRLIVIDEEHDASYKQSENLIYSGRDMAIVRANLLNIPIVMLSATPSCETYLNCKNGKYSLYELKTRYTKVDMPEIQYINLSTKENRPPSGKMISSAIINKTKEILESGMQVLFFLNRRGFASSLLCNHCHNSIGCPHCSVSMAYHKSKGGLICHYCGFRSHIPNKCGFCEVETDFINIGFGVERVKQELDMYFPNIQKQIFSSDAISEANAEDIFGKIHSGEIQIIIGTQMISKGYNFPKLKCVCILDIDSGAVDGDFRVYEKTHQLMMQVGGRAGRFQERGLILIQGYNENHPALLAMISGDMVAFYENELKLRNSKYNPLPPFVRQIAVVIAGDDDKKTYLCSNELIKFLKTQIPKDIKIIGPAPSFIQRINNKYRYRVLFLLPKNNSSYIDDFRNTLRKHKVPNDMIIKIDVDPLVFI